MPRPGPKCKRACAFGKPRCESGYQVKGGALGKRTLTSETIAPGVTVDRIELTYSKLGFGDLFDQLVDKLTNSVDGTVTYADKRFQSLIDSANERIERIDERLLVKQERLQREFLAMESALAQLQSQQSSLGLISQNMGIAQSLLG